MPTHWTDIALGVTKVVAKTAVVVGATIVAGPVGTAVAVTSITAGEMTVDLVEGDYTSAAIDAGFGVLSLATCGVSAAATESAKQGAKEAGKEAARGAAKSAAKEATKTVGKEASKQIAREGLQGAAKEAVVESAKASAKTAAKEATKTVGNQLSKDLAKGMTKQAAHHALVGSMQTSLKEGGKQVGKELYKDAVLFGGKQAAKSGVNNGVGIAVKHCAGKVAAEQSARSLNTFVFGEAAKTGAKEAFGKTTAKYAAVGAVSEVAYISRDIYEGIKKVSQEED